MSIQFQNISYKINNQFLVKNINLRIRPGEIHVLLGKNGAGKSTIFKLLCGDIEPNIGEIFINDKNLNTYNVKSLSTIRSVLTQEYDLNFPFSVSEIVALGRMPFPYVKEKNEMIIQETLDITSIQHLGERDYNTLSGGEKQRTQLSRVLTQIWDSPDKYIFLDEPTSGMDLPNQIKTLEISKQMAEQGYGVFIILHDINLAFQYADTISLIKNGSIYVSGDPSLSLNEEILSDVYDIPIHIIQNKHHTFILAKQTTKEQLYEFNTR
ncbi:MAG: heme ABC transporter ATP-binding protein [Leptospira sp.]|nr:heme ABC transporter ATP-binding protein [Leptospira sp.]